MFRTKSRERDRAFATNDEARKACMDTVNEVVTSINFNGNGKKPTIVVVDKPAVEEVQAERVRNGFFLRIINIVLRRGG